MTRLDRLYSPPEIGAPGKREARQRHRDLFFSGLFVMAMGAVVVAALALLKPGLLGGTYRLWTFFPEAQGLTEGIQILQDGYVIGIVERVTPVFPGRDPDAIHCPTRPADAASHSLPCFRASLRIRQQWPVPRDSQVQLGAAGLLQGDVIRVQPGSAAEPLPDDALITAMAREPDLVTQLGELTRTLQQIVTETIAPALASIKAQIATIETLLGTGSDQDTNQKALAGAFANLQRLTANLETAVDSRQIAAILEGAERTARHLAEVTGQLRGSTVEVQGAVRDYGALAGEIRSLVRDNRPALQRSLDDTQYLLQGLAAALGPILANLEDASQNLSALTRDLRQNPAVILKGRQVEEQTPWFK